MMRLWCYLIKYIIKLHVQGFTATGLKKDEIFNGDISTLYRSKNTVVDVKVDTYSIVREKFLYLIRIFGIFTRLATIEFLSSLT